MRRVTLTRATTLRSLPAERLTAHRPPNLSDIAHFTECRCAVADGVRVSIAAAGLDEMTPSCAVGGDLWL